MHVMKDSDVADNCCRYALSDGSEDYSSICNHFHSHSLHSVLASLVETLERIEYENENQKDDTKYILKEVCKKKNQASCSVFTILTKFGLLYRYMLNITEMQQRLFPKKQCVNIR